MNHIETIEIKNFKSIKHADIKDCRRVNVFIGYPNVGKSNILEAIGLLTFIRKKRFLILEDLVRFERYTQIFNYLKIDEPAFINFNNKYSFEINYADEEELFLRLYETEKVYESSLIGLHVGKEFMNSPSFDGVDEFSGHFDELKDFQVKPYKFSDGKNFKAKYSAKELKVPCGDNLFEVISNNKTFIEEFSDLLKPFNTPLVINKANNEIQINLKSEGVNIFTLPISMIAETLQRLIFHKIAISSNKNSVLLFEEPEAHMFPPYIKKFTTDVIFDKTNQFFIATHSPYVLNEFIEEIADELAVYVVDYDKGETIIKRLTDKEVSEVAQYGVDLFFNLETYLDKNVQHSA